MMWQNTAPVSGAPSSFELPGGVYNTTPSRIVFGAGSVREVAREVERLGAKRALLVCTPGRRAMAEKVIEELGGHCIGVLAEAVSQVPIELARRGQEYARKVGADCLVSFGGGASIGLGKGIALELALPVIAIPTTYSGSEMTGFCGITVEGVKRMHTSLNMLARTVIYDPELLADLPANVSAASAMNALAHCIDAVCVPTISPINRLAAVEGTAAITRNVTRAVSEPEPLSARTELLYGAYLAGAALAGGFALQHGLAHTLGGSFGVSHGLSHALVLPHVAAYNAAFAADAFESLARAAGADHLGDAIFDLLGELNLPQSLDAVGITPDDVGSIVDITVETDNGLNPGPVTTEAVERIVQFALSGNRPSRL